MEKKAFHRTVAVVLVLALLAVAAMLLIPRDDLGNSSGTAMAYELSLIHIYMKQERR